MKKILALLLVAVMTLSLCGCGNGKKTVVLTLDNIRQYLDVKGTVVSCETNQGALILPYAVNRGDATIEIATQNDSGAIFKKVTLTCEVEIGGGGNFGWEFVDGNIPSETRGTVEAGCNDNYKTVKIDLSHDGTGAVTEDLKLALYTDENHVKFADLDDRNISVNIINVVGSAEIS